MQQQLECSTLLRATARRRISGVIQHLKLEQKITSRVRLIIPYYNAVKLIFIIMHIAPGPPYVIPPYDARQMRLRLSHICLYHRHLSG